MRNAPRFFVVVAAAAIIPLAPAQATDERDAAWKKLIAAAVKKGAVETINPGGATASYNLIRSDGMFVTLTRKIDGAQRIVCKGELSKNISTCMEWDTRQMLYFTRASESAPWVSSDVPPVAALTAAEAPPLPSLLDMLLSTRVPRLPFHPWVKGH